MKKSTNKVLKSAMLMADVTQKEVAEEMGINARVFQNKINGTIINGRKAHFKQSEKMWLANKFGIDENEIE